MAPRTPPRPTSSARKSIGGPPWKSTWAASMSVRSSSRSSEMSAQEQSLDALEGKAARKVWTTRRWIHSRPRGKARPGLADIAKQRPLTPESAPSRLYSPPR